MKHTNNGEQYGGCYKPHPIVMDCGILNRTGDFITEQGRQTK